MFVSLLQFAGAAETIGASDGVVKIGLDEIGGVVGGDDKLGDALFVGDDLRYVAVVVKRYDNLASIIAVDYAHLVGRCERAFACKSAACVYQTHHALGYGNGNACVDKYGCVRLDKHVFAFARIQVRPCRIRSAVFGKDCVGIEFFDFYANIVHNTPFVAPKAQVILHRRCSDMSKNRRCGNDNTQICALP